MCLVENGLHVVAHSLNQYECRRETVMLLQISLNVAGIVATLVLWGIHGFYDSTDSRVHRVCGVHDSEDEESRGVVGCVE